METSEKLAQAAITKEKIKCPCPGAHSCEVCLQGHGMGHRLRGMRRRWLEREDEQGMRHMRRGWMRHGVEGVKEMNKPMLVSQLGAEQRKVLENPLAGQLFLRIRRRSQ